MRNSGRLSRRRAGSRGALVLLLAACAAALVAALGGAAALAASGRAGGGGISAQELACLKQNVPAAEAAAFLKSGDPAVLSAASRGKLEQSCGASFGGQQGNGGQQGGNGQPGNCGGPDSQCGGNGGSGSGGSGSGAGGSGAGGGERFNATQLACIKKTVTAREYAVVAKTSTATGLSAAAQKKVLLACAGPGTGGGSGGIALAPPRTGAFIAVSPIDPAQVTRISFFRSCSGHDYSGRNLQGQVETDRSMKHYIDTALPWEPARSLKGVAPFAGTVRVLEEQFPLGKQIQLVSLDTGWTIILFHADPLVANGATVKAGQPIAAWPPTGAVKAFAAKGQEASGGMSFDIAFVSNQGQLDSFLPHLTPAAARAWTARGFTPARAIVSKAKRDADPCNGAYNSRGDADFVAATG